MGPIQEAGLVEAWAFLLQAPDFWLDSCDLLRLLAGRRLQRNQVKLAGSCTKLLQAAWLLKEACGVDPVQEWLHQADMAGRDLAHCHQCMLCLDLRLLPKA